MNEPELPPLAYEGVTIERLTIGDADRLQDLFDRCADFATLIDGHPSKPDAARREFLDAPPGRTPEDVFHFGARASDPALVAILQLARHYPDEESWWLGLLLLDPAWRGRGLGEALCRSAERWTAARGASWLWLSVVEANTRALHFWKRQGFEWVRRTAPRPFGEKLHAVDVLRRWVAAGEPRPGGTTC